MRDPAGANEVQLHSITYRADIDGLRALAVFAVIIYHAYPLSLPGGFIGVDGRPLVAFLEWIPWYLWSAFFIWPILTLLMDELVKRHDHNLRDRYFKFLRMQFDTRLGMWSPK